MKAMLLLSKNYDRPTFASSNLTRGSYCLTLEAYFFVYQRGHMTSRNRRARRVYRCHIRWCASAHLVFLIHEILALACVEEDEKPRTVYLWEAGLSSVC